MAALPENVRQAFEEREGPVILATVDGAGVPNIIYATCVNTFGDDRLVVADNRFSKTRRNLLGGGKGSLLFRCKTGEAYQVKGGLEYHTEGEVFDAMKSWNLPGYPGRGAAVLTVEEVYSGAERIETVEAGGRPASLLGDRA